MKILQDLYYTKEHEWIRMEGDVAYIGITDYAQEELGDIVFVEMPEAEEEFEITETFGVVESVKAVSDLYMPLSGKILEVNEDIEDEPALVNSQPYESWIIKVEITDEEEMEDLLSGDEYQEFLDKED